MKFITLRILVVLSCFLGSQDLWVMNSADPKVLTIVQELIYAHTSIINSNLLNSISCLYNIVTLDHNLFNEAILIIRMKSD